MQNHNKEFLGTFFGKLVVCIQIPNLLTQRKDYPRHCNREGLIWWWILVRLQNPKPFNTTYMETTTINSDWDSLFPETQTDRQSHVHSPDFLLKELYSRKFILKCNSLSPFPFSNLS